MGNWELGRWNGECGIGNVKGGMWLRFGLTANRRIANIEPQNFEGWFRPAQSFLKIDRIHSFDIRYLKTNYIKYRSGAISLFDVQRWTFDVQRSSFKAILQGLKIIHECLQNNFALMVLCSLLSDIRL